MEVTELLAECLRVHPGALLSLCVFIRTFGIVSFSVCAELEKPHTFSLWLVLIPLHIHKIKYLLRVKSYKRMLSLGCRGHPFDLAVR